MQELNNPPMIPGVRYATFGSRFDGILSLIKQKLPGATNIVLQDYCPGDLSGHFAMPYDPAAVEAVRQWLRDEPIHDLPCVNRPIGADVAQVALVSNFGNQELPPPVVYPARPVAHQ